MLQNLELSDPNSCINKADPQEPVFVLRGQDLTSPAFVLAWAELARVLGCNPEKVNEAILTAKKMKVWAEAKNGKFPD